MNIIIDSNVLFSALIKDSLTRRIILEYEKLFLFSLFIFEEMEEHKQELLNKSKMNKEEFEILLSLILKKVIVVPYETLSPFKDKALKLVKDIDKDDIIFVACALAYKDSIIWSDDKGLKKLKNIKVLNTREIINYIMKK